MLQLKAPLFYIYLSLVYEFIFFNAILKLQTSEGEAVNIYYCLFSNESIRFYQQKNQL